ncbi:MAG: hypothetical protein WC273_00805 [Dehalococcoidia bacterium]
MPNVDSERFVIQIKGEGVNVERDVDFDTAWLVMTRIFNRNEVPVMETRRPTPPVSSALPSLRATVSGPDTRPAAAAFETLRGEAGA